MAHYVYKYVYDDEIIYIGKNDTDLKSRITSHKYEKQFKPYKDAKIYYIILPNRIMSDVVESELIRRYKPILNKAKTSEWSGIDFVEPSWIEYKGRKPKSKLDEQTIIKSNIWFDSYFNAMVYSYLNCSFNNTNKLKMDADDLQKLFDDAPLLLRDCKDYKMFFFLSHFYEHYEEIYKTYTDTPNSGLDKAFRKYYIANKRNQSPIHKEKQRIGIEKAKAEGKYKGRQKKKIDEDLFNTLYQRYTNREITKGVFAKTLGVSRPTLDKIINEKI